MSSDLIEEREKEIDGEFNKNSLIDISYSQALWTVLSVVEDKYLKIQHLDKLPNEQLHVHVDVMMNALTLPIRSICSLNSQPPGPLDKHIIDDHYGWAHEWLDKAVVYYNFCSIFPLWRNKKILLFVKGSTLDTSDWREHSLQYEVYNRLVRKDGIKEDKIIDPNEIVGELMPNVSFDESNFKLNLNPKLAKFLIEKYSEVSSEHYNLPDEWQCSYFTFGEFKKVYTAIQAILYGRFIARSELATNGMKGLGYSDAVWVVKISELVSRISRYTNIPIDSVHKILNYLTFGEVGIRYPDIAIQPLIDLKNGFVALSPFVWINSNVERNLCVLLNQVSREKAIYSRLTQQKESILREEIVKEVTPLGYDIAYGLLDDTDLDLAIIDHDSKVCVCFELKWFIEPAEIREVIHKSKELENGVSQAQNILDKYRNNDDRLINKVLDIDESYYLVAAVGSRNWIGYFDVQSEEIPIIKMKHFVEKLKELGSLRATADWLINRDYLPRELIDYDVSTIKLELGEWKSSWYGFKPIASQRQSSYQVNLHCWD